VLPERRRSWQVRRIGHAVLALGVSAVLLGVLGFGYRTIPGLGPALDPGHGAWTSAANGRLPGSQTLRLPGLAHSARVTFTAAGIASIGAATDSDAFVALGYAHARFRLTEMDLERRLGEGRLAQLTGPSAVASDRFELQLGLLRTARQEWAAMPKSSPVAHALTAYARGVNDYLATAGASHQWPALFSMAGVDPAPWTPLDSLVIMGVFNQALSFTTTPLDYALLERSLGARRTMAWFPVTAPGRPSPYDPGPYRNLGMAPASASAGAAASTVAGGRGVPGPRPASQGPASQGTAGTARAAAAILAEVSALPAGQVHDYPDSNAWAVSGSRVAGGGAMLGGDPHVPQTLPSLWYQVALSAPGLAVSGISAPGMPGVLIGHNADIAWSLTDTQNQSVMFYAEKTSASRPGEYFWRGQWRRMQQVHYLIPVRGGPARRLTVDITVHGPVLTRAGQTVAADWTGAIGSPDLAVFLQISKARDFRQFRGALASWRSPAQNFVYADRRGNIGAISAGCFPLVRHGDPWLPLPGTGADDIAGVIPYAGVPHVYNPPGHVVATANQRPVGSSYPYYIGTAANDFDPGFRAATEYAYLRGHSSMGPASFAALQASLADGLARQVVPRLLAALRPARLTPAQQQARRVLAGWDHSMAAGSAAASIWWTFWSDYLTTVFEPWWRAARVPVHLDRPGLAISPEQASLDEVLAYWTRRDRHNPAFSPPGGPAGDAASAMRAAFATAVSHLRASLGGTPASWAWGKLHSRQFPSLTQAAALGYGPRPAGGDPWTVNAADGGLVSSAGPSWRMIVHWNSSGAAVGDGIYPGGESENPASPWYDNLIADWWSGRYLPMPAVGQGASAPGPAAQGAAPRSAARRRAGPRSTGPRGTGRPAAGGTIGWELLP
jgi:penicillin amidase